MKIIIYQLGELNHTSVLSHIKNELERILSLPCEIHSTPLALIPEAKVGKRYNSSIILHSLPVRTTDEHYLGVCDVDLFVPGFNFVFGEAEFMGPRALISLFRLYPQFWGEPPNDEVFLERAVKESIHEMGHTFGLRHCRDPKCVMHFSNSIWDTDLKGALFCPICQQQLERNLLR